MESPESSLEAEAEVFGESQINLEGAFDSGIERESCGLFYTLKFGPLGVPRDPLYKRLAAALYQSMASGNLHWHRWEEQFLNGYAELKQEERGALAPSSVFGRPPFSLLKGALKTIGIMSPSGDTCRCFPSDLLILFSCLDYTIKSISTGVWLLLLLLTYRILSVPFIIEPGDVLLINKTLVLQAELVLFDRFIPTLDYLVVLQAECLEKVLCGVRCIEDALFVENVRSKHVSRIIFGK